MKARQELRILAPLLTAALLALGACGSGVDDAHPAQGVVKGVDVGKREVTIDHEDIPGFMKGMTMTFSVEDPSLLSGLEAGDEVDFEVKLEAGRYVVTAIREAGR